MLQTNENLPQLYRFCFLMTGDPGKAQEAFQSTLREAALHAADPEAPQRDRLWFFREARWRCIASCETGLQPEEHLVDECDVAATAPAQIQQLHPEQLAAWIAGAPEPQRSALAAFYLDEFSVSELQTILDLKAKELSRLISHGRCQFQAWLNAHTPHLDEE